MSARSRSHRNPGYRVQNRLETLDTSISEIAQPLSVNCGTACRFVLPDTSALLAGAQKQATRDCS
jgi:hypothetical protein